MNNSNEGESDSNSCSGSVSNSPQEDQQEQQQQQEEERSDSAPERGAHQPLSPPPLAACMTTASASSCSSSSGRRRFSAARLRATTSGGSRSPPAAAAAAACLPRDVNLYDSLVRYQEDHDDSTTVSMGETLRSVSTWYSVQSDDDRKIPARPADGSYEGTYREPIRRSMIRYPSRGNNSGGSPNSNDADDEDEDNNHNDGNASVGDESSSSSNTNTTAGQANSNVPRAAGSRFPPPAVATRRTSSGSMSRSSRSVASGPPPVVWEEEEDDKDDHTCISSLANHTADRSEEGSVLNRYPLGVLDEGCAVGTNKGGGAAGNHSNGNAKSEFACLSAAAQLSQEANMGNMVETTRSAPNPYGGASSGGGSTRFSGHPVGAQWDTMDWSFPNMSPPHDKKKEGPNHKPPPPTPTASFNIPRDIKNGSRSSNPNMMPSIPVRSIDPSPNRASSPTDPTPPAAAAAMNGFTRMQQTLGMQDLCVPGSTSHSLNGSEQSGCAPLGRNRSGRSQTAPPAAPQAMRSTSSQGTPSAVGTTCTSTEPAGTATTATATSSSSSGGDPAAQEQYQIWKQIQEEQERKQFELALQLSQAATAATRMEPDNCPDYPAQNAKAKPQQSNAGDGGQMDEEEALEVALRISQEEAAASEAAWQHGGASANASNGNADEEEDEFALALRLSEEQAEADRKRFEEMQEGELSEEEQLRLAMEQSMNHSEQRTRGGRTNSALSTVPKHDGGDEDDGGDDEEMRRALVESMQGPEHDEAPDRGTGDDVDEDMMLALRLSQVQMEEEERFRQSFLQPSENGTRSQEHVMGSESFSGLMESYDDSLPPLNRSTSRRGARPQMDDTEIVPPVRSRPSQEPASPGLTPPGQPGGGSPSRRWGRRMGSLRGTKMDMPGTMPHQPSLQDLEDLSHHVRDTFEQQQPKQMKHPSDDSMELQDDLLRGQPHHYGAHPSRVHGPDDGMDMPPVSRPQRKDQQGKSQAKVSARPCNSEAQINNVVDIDRDSRDVLVREGQSETRAAIMQGQSQIVTCRGCYGKLHAPMNCSLVFCPTCNTVSQVTGLGV